MVYLKKTVSNLALFFIIQKRKALKLGKKDNFVFFLPFTYTKKLRFRARKSNSAPTGVKKYTCFLSKKRIFVS